MKEIIADANILLNAAIESHPSHALASQLIIDCLRGGIRIVAPAFWEAEADSALRGMVKSRLLTADIARVVQDLLDTVPVTIAYDPRTRILARQIGDAANRCSVYDATYVALAVARGCELWTADKRFYNAMQNEARGAYPVRLVDDYASNFSA